jgi:hypothetical protein
LSEIVDERPFDLDPFSEELARAGDQAVGTTLRFENDRVRVWEVRLEPGERGPFHTYLHPYLWTCVEGGLGQQRSSDGLVRIVRYSDGETRFLENSTTSPTIHDLENIDDRFLRFITVELLD